MDLLRWNATDDRFVTKLPAYPECPAEIVDPLAGELPGDEVPAVVMGGQVDVVVPAGAVALQEVPEKVMPVGASTGGCRSWHGAQGYRLLLA